MSDIASVDVAVVGSDPLWVVDQMNRLHNALAGSIVRDFVTLLEALDDLEPGAPAVVLLAPEISGGAQAVIQAMAAERPEVAVVGTIDPAHDDVSARDAIEAATGQPAPAADDDERIVATVTDALRQRRDASSYVPSIPATGDGADLDALGVDDIHARALAEDLGAVSHLVTVTAGKGGVGTTTTVLNLAAAAVRDGRSVIVVDAHGATGDVGLALGLAPPAHDELEAGSRSPDAVRRFVVTHEDSGIQVVLLPTTDEHLGAISPALLLDVLLGIDGLADVVVVDAPPALVRDAQLRTYSEHVIVVTGTELASVKDTRVVVSALAEGDPARLWVVLNHVRDRREHVEPADLTPAIGATVVAELPHDDHLGDIRHPVAIAPARSGYAHAMDDLIDRARHRRRTRPDHSSHS